MSLVHVTNKNTGEIGAIRASCIWKFEQKFGPMIINDEGTMVPSSSSFELVTIWADQALRLEVAEDEELVLERCVKAGVSFMHVVEKTKGNCLYLVRESVHSIVLAGNLDASEDTQLVTVRNGEILEPGQRASGTVIHTCMGKFRDTLLVEGTFEEVVEAYERGE